MSKESKYCFQYGSPKLKFTFCGDFHIEGDHKAVRCAAANHTLVKLRTLPLVLKFLEANSPLNFRNFPRPIVPGSVPINSMNKQNNFQSKYFLPIVVQIFQFAGAFLGLSFSLGLNSLVQIILKQRNFLLGLRVALTVNSLHFRFDFRLV